jgi:biopolymer transport protein ExbD
MIAWRTRQRESGSSSLDTVMTPMIDVVFLLLVFFVCTASFKLIEQMLPGTLSAQNAGNTNQAQQTPTPEDDFDQVVLRVGWDSGQPVWMVNDQPLADAGALRELLNSLAAIKPDARLILHPVPEVPMEFVINAWDWSRLAGFEAVAFAVNGGE